MTYSDLFGGAYGGSRVFVTGHTGFKGSWLSAWLDELGATVIGYALDPPTEPSLFERAGIERRLATHHIDDVADVDTLTRTMRETKPEFVFHLAAQPLVRASYSDPRSTFETNVMGTVHVLEAIRATPSVRSAVVVTSDKCYENHEWEYAYRENDAMGGHDPYSSSKGCAELVCSAYRRSFMARPDSPGLATARAGNVIGGGDWATDRILPDCARALSQGQPVQVRNPAAIRPWQHVLESLSGYLWLGSRLAEEPRRFSQGWNFGPADGETWPVSALVEKFVAEWGGGDWRAPEHPSEQLHEAGYLRLDASKAVSLLRWRPVWATDAAVTATARWYRRCEEDPSAAIGLVREDIAEYVAAARGLGVAWVSSAKDDS